MTNINVVENKISSIDKYLKILEGFKKYSKEEIERDLNIKGALERYLYLAIQATIDLSEAAISYKNFRKPTTMREAFQILDENNIISNDLMNRMIKMAGFRNVVAHDYENINYDIVYDVLQNKLNDIKEFSEAISKL